MPYIKRARAAEIVVNPTPVAATQGELNFQLTCVIVAYLESRGMSYATCNDILGALEGAKQEFYRRIVVPYEDRKRIENFDPYYAHSWVVG